MRFSHTHETRGCRETNGNMRIWADVDRHTRTHAHMFPRNHIWVHWGWKSLYTSVSNRFSSEAGCSDEKNRAEKKSHIKWTTSAKSFNEQGIKARDGGVAASLMVIMKLDIYGFVLSSSVLCGSNNKVRFIKWRTCGFNIVTSPWFPYAASPWKSWEAWPATNCAVEM